MLDIKKVCDVKRYIRYNSWNLYGTRLSCCRTATADD